MNFKIFDTVECACGEREFTLENGVTITASTSGPVTQVLCKNVCGFRQCSIATGKVTSEDCRECRRQEILGGTIRCRCGLQWQIINGSPEFAASAPSSFSSDGLRVVEIDWKTDPRWRFFIAAHPEGTIYHHPAWLQILTEEYSQECIALACEDRNGQLYALVPLLYTRGMPSILGGARTARRISSLPRTPVAGPLSIDVHASTLLMEAAVERARKDSCLQLELKSQSPEFEGLVEGLVRARWRPSFVLNIPENPEELRLGDSHSRRHHIRWAVKKAMRSGVQVKPAETEDQFRSWYELYLDTMRRKVVPPRPYRLFHAMWQSLHRRGLMQLLLAEKQVEGQSELLAGSVFLKFGRTVFYAFTGCRREDFSMHPHDLIQWNAIKNAAEEGYRRYDFGEVADDSQSLARFKGKWGAEEVRLYRYYYPAPKHLDSKSLPLSGWPKGIAHRLWRNLPLPITARIGDLLYSYL